MKHEHYFLPEDTESHVQQTGIPQETSQRCSWPQLEDQPNKPYWILLSLSSVVAIISSQVPAPWRREGTQPPRAVGPPPSLPRPSLASHNVGYFPAGSLKSWWIGSMRPQGRKYTFVVSICVQMSITLQMNTKQKSLVLFRPHVQM